VVKASFLSHQNIFTPQPNVAFTDTEHFPLGTTAITYNQATEPQSTVWICIQLSYEPSFKLDAGDQAQRSHLKTAATVAAMLDQC